MPLRLKMLTETQLGDFHDASMTLLSETGIRFFKPEAVEILESHGASAEGNRVRIPASMVEAALKTCPREFVWQGLTGEKR